MMFGIEETIRSEIWMTNHLHESKRARLGTLIYCAVALTIVGIGIIFAQLGPHYILKTILLLAVAAINFNVVVRIYALIATYDKIQMWDALKNNHGNFW